MGDLIIESYNQELTFTCRAAFSPLSKDAPNGIFKLLFLLSKQDANPKQIKAVCRRK
jgi:hypothetical protein